MTEPTDAPSAALTAGVEHAAQEAAAVLAAAPSDIVVRQSSIPSVQQRVMYARELAKARTLPKDYRNSPGDVLFAIELGRDLGMSAASAIVNFHIIEGKPSASAHLMGAKVRQAGHRLRTWVDRADPAKPIGICEIVRADDPDFTFRCEWDFDRAVRANLMEVKNGKYVGVRGPNSRGPGAWDKTPEAMLKARALSECMREACYEVMLGVYTHEELDRIVGDDGDVIDAEVIGETHGQGEEQRQIGPREWTEKNVNGVLDGLVDARQVGTPAAIKGIRDRANKGMAVLGEKKLLSCPVPLMDGNAAGLPQGEHPASAILTAVIDWADAQADATIVDAEVVHDAPPAEATQDGWDDIARATREWVEQLEGAAGDREALDGLISVLGQDRVGGKLTSAMKVQHPDGTTGQITLLALAHQFLKAASEPAVA